MIPIYRAKRIDSDELIEGSYIAGLYAIIPNDLQGKVINGKIDIDLKEITRMRVIDPTTLSIHFPDMLDSQGNKIFASLSNDGKGGDISNCGKTMIFDSIETIPYFESWSSYTITKIKQ